jgi:CheY-like chemotaxis protein
MIAISGYAQEGDRQRSRVSGFDAHLAKPVDIDKLFEHMATAPA